MGLVAEVCRESQTLIPRLIEAGILENLLVKGKEALLKGEDLPEFLPLISNLCLHEAGRPLERNYKIVELYFEMFTKPDFGTLHEKWFYSDVGSLFAGRKGTILDRLDREMIYMARYIDKYTALIVDSTVATAKNVIAQAEKYISEMKNLKKSPVEPGKPDPEFDAKNNEWLAVYQRLSNFAIFYVKFLKDSRMRANLYGKGGFDLLLSLLSYNYIFSFDHERYSTVVPDYFYSEVGRELENGDITFIENLNNAVFKSFTSIESVVGGLKALRDFSKLIDFDFIETSKKEGMFKALYSANLQADQILNVYRNIGLIVCVLKSFKGNGITLQHAQNSEKLLYLYSAIVNQTALYSSQKSQKHVSDIIANQKPNTMGLSISYSEIFNEGMQAFLTIKYIIDQNLMTATQNTTGFENKSYPGIVLSIFSMLKDLGDYPSKIEDQLLWTQKAKYINEIAISCTDNDHFRDKTSLHIPGVMLSIYEEQGYDMFIKHFLTLVNVVVKDLSQTYDINNVDWL